MYPNVEKKFSLKFLQYRKSLILNDLYHFSILLKAVKYVTFIIEFKEKRHTLLSNKAYNIPITLTYLKFLKN